MSDEKETELTDAIDKARNALDSLARLSRRSSSSTSSSSSSYALPVSRNSLSSSLPGSSSSLNEASSRALQTVKDLRRRYASEEQKKNFSPYQTSSRKNSMRRRRTVSWTLKAVCLACRQQRRVPIESKYKEQLVEAGLGEKKIVIPDIDCNATEFKDILHASFPKLKDAGGYELMRCVANSRALELISATVARLPRLLKAVIGSGRVFIRPIQRDLSLTPELESPETKETEECIHCGVQISVCTLRKHIKECQKKKVKKDDEGSSDDFMDSPLHWNAHTPPLLSSPPNSPKASTPIVLSDDDDHDNASSEDDVQATENLMVDHAVAMSREESRDDTQEHSSAVEELSAHDMVEKRNHMPSSIKEAALFVLDQIEDQEFVFSISRASVFQDAMMSLERLTFSPKKKVSVIFRGEEGDDFGGPRREFWSLLSSAIQENICEGRPESSVLKHDAVGLMNKKFFLLGQLMATSIGQEGAGFPFFSPSIYDYICGKDPISIEVNNEDVADYEIKEILENLTRSSSDEEIRKVALEAADMIIDSGYSRPISALSINDRKQLCTTIALHHIILKSKSELDQLKDGLRALGVLNILEKEPECLRKFFTYSECSIVTADQLLRILSNICFSEKGTRARQLEEKTYSMFVKFVYEVERGAVSASQPETREQGVYDQEPESSLQIYREVFDLCDKDKNGYITKDELSHICNQVSDEEVAASVLDNVMVCLDSNHDGHITFEEFKAGFETFQRLQGDSHGDSVPAAVSSSTPAKPSVVSKEEVYESEPALDGDEAAWREVADRIDPQGALAGTGVSEVWKELNQRDPALLESFEGFLSQVISELRQSDMERSTLQTHVKRILEQHSKEVSEMDHLLQEELKLAKANHQQTNASQTSRLSNHYSGLLAQREALIEELATQETDLKHALQEKTRKESQLKEDKTLLLTANKALQEQLDTTLRSESGTTLGSAGESGRSTGGSGDEGTGEAEAPTLPRARSMGRGEEGEGVREGEEEPRFIVTSPDSSLRLSVMQESGDQDQRKVKYFPPKKYRVMGHVQDSMSTDSDAPHTSQGHASLHRTVSSQSGAVSVTADSAQTVPASSLVHKDESPPFDDMVSTASLKHTAGLGLLGQPRSLMGHTPHSAPHSTVATPSCSSDVALGMSGVMPRRGQLPGPPTPTNHPLTRVFKVIFLGEPGVGKSSLIGFLSSGAFPDIVKTTVGLDYKVKTLRIEDETVVFQLWDTAGQERFNNALTPVYFRRADAFVIVYDVTDLRTFKATNKWVSIIKAALREQPPVIMLVGNKSDRTSQRCVSVEDGRTLALELKALFSEMSALSGDNVLQAHSTLAQLLLTRENADLQEIRKHAGTPSKSKCSC